MSVDESIDSIARRLMQDGIPDSEIEARLKQQGFSSTVAAAAVSRAIDWSAARKDMTVGGVVFIAGVVITVGSMALVGSGGTYVLVWGAIVFGAIQFMRGYSQMKKVEEAEVEAASDTSRDEPPPEFESLPAESPPSLLSIRWIWWLAGAALVVFGGYVASQITKGNMHW